MFHVVHSNIRPQIEFYEDEEAKVQDSGLTAFNLKSWGEKEEDSLTKWRHSLDEIILMTIVVQEYGNLEPPVVL